MSKKFQISEDDERDRLFNELSYLQRGKPEDAMLKIQRLVPGVMSFVVEHAGDLIHRSTEPHATSAKTFGKGYVKFKAENVLSTLEHPYGFAKEFRENIEQAAAYRKEDPKELELKVYEALNEYAFHHASLPAYNELHQAYKKVCIAIGRGKYRTAREYLKWIIRVCKNQELYLKIASSMKKMPTLKINPRLKITKADYFNKVGLRATSRASASQVPPFLTAKEKSLGLSLISKHTFSRLHNGQAEYLLFRGTHPHDDAHLKNGKASHPYQNTWTYLTSSAIGYGENTTATDGDTREPRIIAAFIPQDKIVNVLAAHKGYDMGHGEVIVAPLKGSPVPFEELEFGKGNRIENKPFGYKVGRYAGRPEVEPVKKNPDQVPVLAKALDSIIFSHSVNLAFKGLPEDVREQLVSSGFVLIKRKYPLTIEVTEKGLAFHADEQKKMLKRMGAKRRADEEAYNNRNQAPAPPQRQEPDWEAIITEQMINSLKSLEAAPVYGGQHKLPMEYGVDWNTGEFTLDWATPAKLLREGLITKPKKIMALVVPDEGPEQLYVSSITEKGRAFMKKHKKNPKRKNPSIRADIKSFFKTYFPDVRLEAYGPGDTVDWGDASDYLLAVFLGEDEGPFLTISKQGKVEYCDVEPGEEDFDATIFDVSRKIKTPELAAKKFVRAIQKISFAVMMSPSHASNPLGAVSTPMAEIKAPWGGKAHKVYAIFSTGDWTWIILSKIPKNTDIINMALVVSPICPDGELGSVYKSDVAHLTQLGRDSLAKVLPEGWSIK